jgi:hypothetical protein
MLELTAEEHEELSHWAQSRMLAAGDVFRARLILAFGNRGVAFGATYPRQTARDPQEQALPYNVA